MDKLPGTPSLFPPYDSTEAELLYNHFINQIVNEVESISQSSPILSLIEWNKATLEAYSSLYGMDKAVKLLHEQNAIFSHLLKVLHWNKRLEQISYKMIDEIPLSFEEKNEVDNIHL